MFWNQWRKHLKSQNFRQIPYDLTYMWNLKDKINEQTKLKQTQRAEGWLPEQGRSWGTG